jgi:hypothetical protein
MKHYAVFLVSAATAASLSLCWLPRRAAAEFKEPTGWDKVTFLMGEEQVKKIYPDMVKVEGPTGMPNPVPDLPPFPLVRYQLSKQKVGDMQCQVVFQFFQQRLTHLEFYCGNAAKAQEYLLTEYGEPSLKGDSGWQWLGKKALVTFNPKTGIFNIASKRGHDALQGTLYLYFLASKDPEQKTEQRPPTIDLNKPESEDPQPAPPPQAAPQQAAPQ